MTNLAPPRFLEVDGKTALKAHADGKTLFYWKESAGWVEVVAPRQMTLQFFLDGRTRFAIERKPRTMTFTGVVEQGAPLEVTPGKFIALPAETAIPEGTQVQVQLCEVFE